MLSVISETVNTDSCIVLTTLMTVLYKQWMIERITGINETKP